VEAHTAKLTVASDEGHGAKFEFTLPGCPYSSATDGHAAATPP
jgi:signal transduction histidine kinase